MRALSAVEIAVVEALEPAAAAGRLSGATHRLLHAIAWFFHVAGAALLALMCALICTDAVARLAFNAPFAGTTELVAAMVVLVTCLQVPYVLIHGLLLRVTYIVDFFGSRVAGALNALAYAAGFAFFAAISSTSVEPLLKSISAGEYEGTLTLQIPVWPLRLTTCVLWALAALVCLSLVIDGARALLRRAP
jgi:TRAP-type C4-dicarboxylate transport system permease small subunit